MYDKQLIVTSVPNTKANYLGLLKVTPEFNNRVY